jgi:hypothetical protein
MNLGENKSSKFELDENNIVGFYHEVFIEPQSDTNQNNTLTYTIGFIPNHRFSAKFKEDAPNDYVEYGLNRAELRVQLFGCEVDRGKSVEGGELVLEIKQNVVEKHAQGEKVASEVAGEIGCEATKSSGKVNTKLVKKRAKENQNQEENTVSFESCHITALANLNNIDNPMWVFTPHRDVLKGRLDKRHLCHILKTNSDPLSGKSFIDIKSNDIFVYNYPTPPGFLDRVFGMGDKWMKRTLANHIIEESKKPQAIKVMEC